MVADVVPATAVPYSSNNAEIAVMMVFRFLILDPSFPERYTNVG
jgi:hypothetical protein